MRLSTTTFVFAFAVMISSTACNSKPVRDAEPVRMEVAGERFVADFYSMEQSPRKLGILVLGGSEGGKAEYFARILAQQGYPVLSLAYFKTPGTPEYLDMIPLEYFDKPIQWLKTNTKVQNGGIVVVGGSKGAELALLLASRIPDIRGVIAVSPSSVVWQGIPKDFWPPRSSWSIKGKPVSFVPYDVSKGFDPNDLLSLYQQSLSQKERVQQATIEVENIQGPVLLLSGRQDSMWPSREMGDMICERLKARNFRFKWEHIKYDDAGHTLNEYFMIGGTAEGNQKARLDSTKRMLEFLKGLEAEPKISGQTAK
jgi:uncharacterized protein